MKARWSLSVVAALVLLLGAACGEFEPTSLRLVTHGEFLRDQTVQIEVIGIDDDGNEEVLKKGLTFRSSDERIATVDPNGLVTVHAGGPVTISVTAKLDSMEKPLEASIETRATCQYPEFDWKFGQGKVVPPLAWPAFLSNGDPIFFKLEDVYCDADWEWVKTIHFVFSAGWCGPCSMYAMQLARQAGSLRREGMLVVTVEIDTEYPGVAADSNFAKKHLAKLAEMAGQKQPAGIAAGDKDTHIWDPEARSYVPAKNFIRRSDFIAFYPTKSIVRKRDMQMIVDGSGKGAWAGKVIPLLEIARDPEADWSKPPSWVDDGEIEDRPEDGGTGGE